jgi:DNA invertase Pin-like site-specific DNA recombinase
VADLIEPGSMIYDPTDLMGKMFFNIVATFAELEVDLPRIRTREGMAIAKAEGQAQRPGRRAIPTGPWRPPRRSRTSA